MAEKKIATRDSYAAALLKLAEEREDLLVFDADLAEATRTARFRDAFPDRFVDCGIAEANMMGVAAGISTMGYVPFVSTFAMFAAGRAFEQVRNSIGYPHLNVKIGATHGGISVGADGATHQCNEDFALMRAIPGMTVLCPSDDVEAKQMVRAAYAVKGPVYMRFGRMGVPVLHDASYAFRIGRGEILREGADVALIANGILVHSALAAAERLYSSGISARVINMATIKPLDEALVLAAAHDCGRVVTVEEHSVVGGLGEAVAAVLSEGCPVPLRRIGIPDVFGHSASAEELLAEFGLGEEGIFASVKEFCCRGASDGMYGAWNPPNGAVT